MKPIVQISLDLISIPEALETAELALRAGVDWLEAGTPLIIAEGMNGVRTLRKAFPNVPIVADLKTMDGGYLEAELMFKAGATHVVVMGQAQSETVELVVQAGKDFGVKVMGDNLGMPDHVKGAKLLADLGCDYVIHHIAYDVRTLRKQRALPFASPLDELKEVVNAVNVPVQAVGGLTIEQAMKTPEYGAPLVVIGAPLAIDAHSFKTADGNLEAVLKRICDKVHAYGDIPVG
jgi:3-hexulose-6-phosphate synthase